MQGCGVLTMDKFINNGDGSIEDLIGRTTYFGLINLCYKLPRKKRLSPAAPDQSVSTESHTKCLVSQVEDYFATAGYNLGSFDRYKPAEFLIEHTKKCLRKLPDLDGALDRFERLFEDVKTCRKSLRVVETPGFTQARPILDIETTKKAGQFTEAEKSVMPGQIAQ
jgi:hypothetical protein